jgi:hypothetical protein
MEKMEEKKIDFSEIDFGEYFEGGGKLKWVVKNHENS